MKFDEALEITNSLGRTQFVVAASACFATFASAFVNLSNVFLAEIPEFHCSSPSEGAPLNTSVPINDDGSYSECEQFVSEGDSDTTEKCTNGWDYDQDLYGKSIVTEFDLVCDDGALPDLSQSILIAGLGVGALIAGPVADKWGRRPTFMVSLVAFNLVGVAVSFSVNYSMFVTLRFLWAMLNQGFWLPPIVMLYEYLTPRHRSTIGNVPAIFFSIGVLTLPFIAFFIRDWRSYNAVIMIPTVVMMLLIWVFPESARWLLSAHRYNRAEDCMQGVAKFNKATSVPTKFFEEYDMKIGLEEDEDGSKSDTTAVKPSRLGFSDVWKPPLLAITVVLGIQWFCFFLVYFGFALSTGSLAGDPYLSFFISGLFEVPARIIPLWLLKRSGSIIPTSLCLTISCGIMIAMTLLDTGSLGFTICAFFGRFFVTFIFTPLMLLSSDLYPTPIRNIGMGVVNLFGRFGSILAPLLLFWDNSIPGLAFSSMAALAALSAILVFLLPETLNVVHPTTIEDVKVMVHTRRLITLNGCRNPRSLSKQQPDASINKAEDTSIAAVNENGGKAAELGMDNPVFETTQL